MESVQLEERELGNVTLTSSEALDLGGELGSKGRTLTTILVVETERLAPFWRELFKIKLVRA